MSFEKGEGMPAFPPASAFPLPGQRQPCEAALLRVGGDIATDCCHKPIIIRTVGWHEFLRLETSSKRTMGALERAVADGVEFEQVLSLQKE